MALAIATDVSRSRRLVRISPSASDGPARASANCSRDHAASLRAIDELAALDTTALRTGRVSASRQLPRAAAQYACGTPAAWAAHSSVTLLAGTPRMIKEYAAEFTQTRVLQNSPT